MQEKKLIYNVKYKYNESYLVLINKKKKNDLKFKN